MKDQLLRRAAICTYRRHPEKKCWQWFNPLGKDLSDYESLWIDCEHGFNAETHGYDASLIDACTAMLEALKNIENDDGHLPQSAWDMVQNAISKAELAGAHADYIECRP